MATQIQIENNIHLERLMSTNPKMVKEIQSILRKVIREAAKQVSLSASAVIANDPRKAANAVRSTVYKNILGANVNLYNSRKAGKGQPFYPVRRLRDGQRGGNRRTRVDDARNRLETYYGSDRGFILRFLASGTVQRQTRFGNRGSIRQSNWFGHTAPWQMESAAEKVASAINEYVKQQTNG